MTDLTSEILARLRSHRIDGLDFGDEFIYPFYEGGSILNIPASICRLFGVPEIGAPPFFPEILSPLQVGFASGIDRIVMILMDALAFHRFKRWVEWDSVKLWKSMVQDGLLVPLTSIVPSTTSAALPTLWSGLSPTQHGMVGYELWLKEFGVVANMIQHSPFNLPGNLEKAGFNPEEALPGPTLGRHLAGQGIKSYAFQHFMIARSALSRVFLKDVHVHAFGTAVELAVNLRHLVESRPLERQFIGVYWGQVDRLSHEYGPDDERPAGEFANFSGALEEHFLNELSHESRKGTMLVLTADHGQITTQKDQHFDLKTHPNLARRLPILPTGENRLIYFNIRPGQVEAVREYLDRAFMRQFIQLNPEYVVEKGLFGPGDPHPQIRDRLGDLLAIAKGDSYLWWSQKKNPIIGRHGGMSPEEMLVPFLVARL